MPSLSSWLTGVIDSFTHLVNGTNYPLAEYLNKYQDAIKDIETSLGVQVWMPGLNLKDRLERNLFESGNKDSRNLSATLTLADTDKVTQLLNCNGANRIAKMPTGDAVNNHAFWIGNSTASGNWTLTIQDNAGTVNLCVLLPGAFALLLPDGSGGYKVVNYGVLDFPESTELTIASGSVTPTQNWHTLDTEGDASTDDLDTLVTTNVTDGFIILFRANNGGRTIVVKHNTGNIVTTTAADITLDETYKLCIGIYDASLSKWIVGLLGGSMPSSGWTEISESWSYASSSTITVPTDATIRYSKGVKIRLKQGGGYKYYIGRIIASTLLTVIVNTDYTVANSAITDIAISYLERPEGFPTSFAFTSTLTASTTNPTGLTTTGKLVVQTWGITCFISSVAGASPTNGSGYYIWSLPFTSVVSGVGPMHISDANVGRFTGSVVQAGGAQVIGITSAGNVTHTSPIATLAVGDSFDFSVDLLW